MTTSIQEENKKLEAQRKKNRNRRIREVLAKKDSKKNLLEQQLKNAKTLTQLSSVYRKGALFFHSNKGGTNINFILWRNLYNRRKRNLI
jgi:regulator of replication initiation timing|tara:strand:+ start:263 stop:529 length:267 start_codon:yes stop_codon:yes gene_type:complete